MTQSPSSEVQLLAHSRLFIFGLVATTSGGPMAMQLFVPSLPFMAHDLAAPIDIAQLALSLSMAAIALANLVYGPLSDRFGRRPVLLIGLILFLIGTAIAATATSIEMLVVGRIIQAGGSASGMVISRAMVRDVYGAEKAASMIAYLTVAMLAAPYVALIVGGVLTDNVGWRASLWLAFVVGGLVTVIAFRTLSETHYEDRMPIAPLNLARNYTSLFRSIEFTGYVLHTAFAAGTFFAFMAAAPYLMVDVMGRTALEFSLWFALLTFTFMGANMAAGRVSARVGLDPHGPARQRRFPCRRRALFGHRDAVRANAVDVVSAQRGRWHRAGGLDAQRPGGCHQPQSQTCRHVVGVVGLRHDGDGRRVLANRRRVCRRHREPAGVDDFHRGDPRPRFRPDSGAASGQSRGRGLEKPKNLEFPLRIGGIDTLPRPT